MASAQANENIRYEPDERPSSAVAIGAGIQAALIIVAPVVVTIVIVMRLAEQSESYITWAIFAALLVSGATTILQASKIGRTAWRT